jgi:hypothetical protein
MLIMISVLPASLDRPLPGLGIDTRTAVDPVPATGSTVAASYSCIIIAILGRLCGRIWHRRDLDIATFLRMMIMIRHQGMNWQPDTC